MIVSVGQAFAFFDYIFGEFVQQGVMMAAEVDFLNWSQLTVPALFSTLDGVWGRISPSN